MIVLQIILIIGVIFGLCILYRNEKVYKFRINTCDRCHDILASYINGIEKREDLRKYIDLENKLSEILLKHSYSEMLYSFKPLKLEEWYTKEEIDLMTP